MGDPDGQIPEDDIRQADFFANRLKKRDRHLRKWARREGITAYRVYDRDIPEIPLSVDRYGNELLMALYERPYEKPDDEEDAWLSLMTGVASNALGIESGLIHMKTRKHQLGSSQYERHARTERFFEVAEGGLAFLVNLDDYLDSGLFLDHRITRSMVGGLSRGKAVLNLFCYTGSFSVYAASGGATIVDSVDLSATYLDWTRRNLERNGCSGENCRGIRSDARVFMEQAAAEGRKYGIIVLDPPTFSNSKRMREDFDLNRDWAELIALALEMLDDDGSLFFSTNARRFKLDAGLVENAKIEDLTDATTPPDYRGHPHRCWRISKTG
ncbi:MAG: class I SAM-dependent methyltransferase [Spirochaetes bacterium]|nr:class I SAM-dependent methyltransferase [Spirochaetota bacterium]